jgi:hypothetical protein
MDKLSKFSKIFLFLTLVFGVLWLGGYLTRQLVVYQFFNPEDLSIRSLYNNNNLDAAIKTIAPIFVSNLVLYIAFLITFLVFFFTAKINLKIEGWLFFISLIILITAPFEIYLTVKDYKIISDIYLSADVSASTILNNIKERMQLLSSFSLIEILSFIGIIFLIIFKPLRKANEN